MDLPRYGLRFDRAYWVSGIEVRAPETPQASGAVAATTLARGGHERSVARRHATVARAGGVSPALLTEQRVVDGSRIEKRNGFRARLRNLAAVRFDTAGMGLDPRREIVAQLRGDGETAITLTGRFPRGTKAFLDGKPLTLRRSRRAVRVVVELTDADAHVLRVARQ